MSDRLTQTLAVVLASIIVLSVIAVPTAAASPDVPHTRNEIAQEKFGQEFIELSEDTRDAVEEIYDRQPFAEGVSLSDVQTRDELAQDRHGVEEFEDLSEETKREIEEVYDRQFEGGEKAFTRDEISQAKYGYDFGILSGETMWEVEEIYDRQPFVSFDRTQDPADILTREEIAQEKYGQSYDSLSRETQLEVEDLYDQQFPLTVVDETEPPEEAAADFRITGINSPTVEQGETATINATVENVGDETGTQAVALSVEGNLLVDQEREVSLDVGETQEVSFEVNTTALPPDTYDVTIGTANDTATTTLLVLESGEAGFDPQFTDLTVPDTPSNETLVVTTTVENVGNEIGATEVLLTIEDLSISRASGTFDLDPGESNTVTFEIDGNDTEPGTFVANVSTLQNDTASTTFDITEPVSPPPSPGAANFQVTSLNAPTAQQGETSNVTATVENTGDATGTQNISLLVEGENISVGTGAVDIVFVVDDSGTMDDDIDTVQRELSAFAQRLQAGGVRAEYAVVTITDGVTVRQNFVTDVDRTNQTLERIRAEGRQEYNYDGIQRALDLDGRENAKRVIIDLTDEDSDVQQGTPTQQELADRMNATNTTYIAVTPTSDDLENPSAGPAFEKRPLANRTESGQWYDLLQEDFGDQFSTGVAEDIINVTRESERERTLDPGESTEVAFPVDTTDLPPADYDVTVATANDSETTTLTVTARPSGQAVFELVNVVSGAYNFPDIDSGRVSAEVANVGNASGTVTVSAVVNNSTTTLFEGEQDLTIAAGEDEDAHFEVETEASVGIYNATVTVGNQTGTAELIRASGERPTLRTASIDAPDTEQGETANISAQMINEFDLGGTGLITLRIENTSVDRTIEENFFRLERKPVFFEVDTTDLDPGTYTVVVETNLGQEKATLNVTAPSDGAPNGTATFEFAGAGGADFRVGGGGRLTGEVENTGDATGTQNVTVTVSNATTTIFEAEQSVTLDAGESAQFGFPINNLSAFPGTYEAEFTTANDTATAQVTIRERPGGGPPGGTNPVGGTKYMVVDILGTAGYPGDTVTAETTIRNTGDDAGVQTVTLDFANDTAFEDQEQSVSLAPDDQERLTFNVSLSGVSPGPYSATFVTANDSDDIGVGVYVPNESTFSITRLEEVETAQGRTANVSMFVNNIAGGDGTGNVTLRVEGTNIEQTQSRTIPLNEELPTTFPVDTTDLEPGTYTLIVETNYETETTTLTVTEPPEGGFDTPNFQVTDFVSNGSWTRDDIARISTNVTNTGNATGTQTVTFTQANETTTVTTDSVDLTLDPGETETVYFPVETQTVSLGNYTLTVETENDTVTRRFELISGPV